MEYNGWREEHYNVIDMFLYYLNSVSDDYVLKGGTSLMMCYGLTRFSEDIDLDGFSNNIGDIVDKFCSKNGVQYRVAKDTDTVKRYMIHYSDSGNKPLKVEISYRMGSLDFDTETDVINDIRVYTIQNILTMKLNAYMGRDKIRDLYDVVFIGLEYWDYLDSSMIFKMQDAFGHKGIEQFDYVIKDQEDELIDNDYLAEEFLILWDKLGLK